jgi:hypothetical protein
VLTLLCERLCSQRPRTGPVISPTDHAFPITPSAHLRLSQAALPAGVIIKRTLAPTTISTLPSPANRCSGY